MSQHWIVVVEEEAEEAEGVDHTVVTESSRQVRSVILSAEHLGVRVVGSSSCPIHEKILSQISGWLYLLLQIHVCDIVGSMGNLESSHSLPMVSSQGYDERFLRSEIL